MLIFRPISVPIGLLHCLHPKSSLLPTGTEILKTLLTVPAIMLHQTRFRHIFSFLLCLNGAHILHVRRSTLTKIIHFLDSMFPRFPASRRRKKLCPVLTTMTTPWRPQPFPAIRSWPAAATVPCRSVSVRLFDDTWRRRRINHELPIILLELANWSTPHQFVADLRRLKA